MHWEGPVRHIHRVVQQRMQQRMEVEVEEVTAHIGVMLVDDST